MSLEELRTIARVAGNGTALVRIHGQWVEVDGAEAREALARIEAQPDGEMTLLEAIRLAHGGDAKVGLPVEGLDATGWVSDLLEASSGEERLQVLDAPDLFKGELRPYQQAGLSWLAFLDRFGLGACLADDMGLGKTIQLIALMLMERERVLRARGIEPEDATDEQLRAASPGPTLLVVPTSVLGNWTRELERFAPRLSSFVQHGPDRAVGERFEALALEHDLVLTTYTLISRDRDSLVRVPWHRVVLDEAQYIKNPPTKQTATIRGLRTGRRIALTGTPVENRLSELWSIMDFCNPGYLGPPAEFRRRYAIPIERRRSPERAERLRAIVRPFILRRLKTDPRVIDDLPDCVTTKEFATLTPEQARLYEQTVERMLGEVRSAEGIRRRGLVLATLVRLKQICNHPALVAADPDAPGESGSGRKSPPPVLDGKEAVPGRSGKCRRLMEMMDELVAAGDKALVFTQFRRMGHLLNTMLRHELDEDVLFLHGGTPPAKRQALIDRFQDPKGGAPIFVLSLRAGGVGLNLTAANHVFHFDRWWNPAVENQATDRAFRIGQTRTVHVHKFVCVGTLEERIDRMIEQKLELAENIIGAGEDWLTELSTVQLRDMLQLREDAVEIGEGGRA